MVAPKVYIHVLISRSCDCHFIWQKCEYYLVWQKKNLSEVKDCDSRNVSWIIWVGCKYNKMYPYKGEAGGVLRQKGRRQCDHGGKRLE